MTTEDQMLADVVDGAKSILRAVFAQPSHIRPWLRGIQAEAERVVVDVSRIRGRASSRFVSWALEGALTEDSPGRRSGGTAPGARDSTSR